MATNRRSFIQHGAFWGIRTDIISWLLNACGNGATKEETASDEKPMQSPSGAFFKISLAEWSLHKTLFSGKITNLDFPGIAKTEFGIEGIEFVNQFFKDKAEDQAYLTDLKSAVRIMELAR